MVIPIRAPDNNRLRYSDNKYLYGLFDRCDVTTAERPRITSRAGNDTCKLQPPPRRTPALPTRHNRTVEKSTNQAHSASSAPERHPANNDQRPGTPGIGGFCVTHSSQSVCREQPTHRIFRARVDPSTRRGASRRPNWAGASIAGRAVNQSIQKRSEKGDEVKKVPRCDHIPSAGAEENPCSPIRPHRFQ